ncbi:MAG: hypothetical protein ABR592_11970 [Nitriliruptorales bacterium]
MDLKTIIAVAPFLRRLYRRMPRSLRVVGLVVALVVGVRRLFGGRREEAEGSGETGVRGEE